MAFDIGSVVAHVKADITNFQQGMSKVSSTMDQAAGGARGLGGAFGRIGEIAAGVGLERIAEQLLQVGKAALAGAASFEQSRVAFDTMIGSADKAKKLLREISDFAVKTPFELPQLVDGAKRLLAYNVEADKIIPTLKMLGEMSAGVGTEKLPQLILAFGQVKAATKLTGAELRQFSEAGVPLLQALVDKANEGGGALVKVGGSAKKSKVDVGELNDKLAIASQRLKEAEGNAKTKQSTLMSLRNTVQNYKEKIAEAGTATGATSAQFVRTKITAAEMMEKISDGEVTFEQVQQALQGMTGEGGKFFNLMDRQSKTFGGVVSNIKDQLGRLMREAMGIDVEGNIAEGSVFQKLSQAANALLTALSAATPYVIDAVTKITEGINWLMDAAQPLVDWIMQNQELVLSFFKGVGVALAGLMIIATIAGLIAMVTNPIFLIAAAIGLLFAAWQADFMGMRGITDWFVNAIKLIFNDILIPFFELFKKWWSEHWESNKKMLVGTWDIIVGAIQVATAVIYGVVGAFLAILKGDWGKAWEIIKRAADMAWDGLQKLFGGIISYISGWGGNLVTTLTQPFRDAWNKISEYIQKIKDGLDFTKRHSPSILDIVNKGVREVNRAYDRLDFGTFNPHANVLYAGAPAPASPIAHVNVNLDGALIGSEFDALRIGEKIGDSIIKKLQVNVRF